MDYINVANSKSLSEFKREYFPPSEEWGIWTHPTSKTRYTSTLETAQGLSAVDFEACFHLIEYTSADDYKNSKTGWKPRSKKKEMELLDLKYILVKDPEDNVKAFASFMPTYEDEYPVIYCYEIHLCADLQGVGLGKVLMRLLETSAVKIPGTEKIMLTCFICNQKGINFYEKLGFVKDEFSPPPKILRNGTKVESDAWLADPITSMTTTYKLHSENKRCGGTV